MYQVKSVSAVRVLVLYTRTVNPSQKLVDLTTYIVQVYGPAWFRIKGRTDNSFFQIIANKVQVSDLHPLFANVDLVFDPCDNHSNY